LTEHVLNYKEFKIFLFHKTHLDVMQEAMKIERKLFRYTVHHVNSNSMQHTAARMLYGKIRHWLYGCEPVNHRYIKMCKFLSTTELCATCWNTFASTYNSFP